jgi:Putative MetA-pathway of phenol degradation
MKLISIATFLLIQSIFGESQAESEVNNYHLFYPVPESLIRDFDTDRPDKTNSPHTLDAGHFQIEIGFASYTYDNNSRSSLDSFIWGDSTLRCGLLSFMELQLEIPTYIDNKNTNSGITTRSRGMGDLTATLKTNFWGNTEGKTSAGMSYFMKIPTANKQIGNGKTEGGIIFLSGYKLPMNFDLGINNGIAMSANDDKTYRADIFNSISVSHQLIGPFSAYLEFFCSVPTKNSNQWIGTVDTGLLLMLGKNLQLDVGVNNAVTSAASNLQIFCGTSYRF